MIIVYYLLYKLVDYPQLWIVKVDTVKDELLEHIYKFESSNEQYYIIERSLNNDTTKSDTKLLDELLKRKQFARFIPSNDDYIVSESKLITNTYYKHSKYNSFNSFKKYNKKFKN
jgi:hypothetical protein